MFYPITPLSNEWEEFNTFQTNFKSQNNADFVIFWNNRNIRRKAPGDLILAYKHFCDQLPKKI